MSDPRAQDSPPAAIDETPFSPVPGRARRRSEALAPLSREHHRALAQAIRLKRAEPAEARDALEDFISFWNEEGSEHFAEEETVLLPAYAAVADPAHPAVVRTFLEHVLIRARITTIRGQSETSASDLRLLGDWLERHVRLEERVLFPLIEDALPEPALRGLVEALSPEDTPT